MGKVKNSTGAPPPIIPPYSVKISGGYRGLKLNDQNYSGFETSIEIGQAFPHDKKTQGFLTGQASLSWLKPQGEGSSLKTTGFGFKGGVKRKLGTGAALSLWGSLGTEIFASKRVNPSSEEIAVALDQGAGLSLGAGINLSFLKEVLSLEAGIKGVFGIPGSPQTDYPWPVAYNSLGYFFNAGVNLAKWVARKKEFAEPNGEKFAEDLIWGMIFESSYTYNFNKPSDNTNILRSFYPVANQPIFNLFQVSLKRPADENTPIGFGIAFDAGENPNVSAARDSFAGNFYDFQQLYTETHLPLGNGLTVQVGKIPTIIGLELIEPLNNQISRSWAFEWGIPFTHGGALATYPINQHWSLKAGLVNGWDKLYSRNTGISGLYGLFATLKDWVSFSITGATGLDQSVAENRLLNILDGILTFKGGERLPWSLTFNGDWGYQGNGGAESPKAHWLAASISPRINFGHHASLSARGEVFHDGNGVRTGNKQTLGHVAATLHLKPVPEKYFRFFPLEIRTEVRSDHSKGAKPFLQGDEPNNSQTTFAISATLNFANILDLWRKKDE